MGLISYTQIEDGQEASANSLNVRFGKIHEEINGKLDASNIKDNAITGDKIANGAIDKNKLDIKQYIDDNGWTVTDMGGIKTYNRIVMVDGSEYDGNGNPGSKGLLIDGNGARRELVSFPPPVGRRVDNVSIVATYFGGYSGHLVVSGEIIDNKIMIAGGNIWPNKLSFKGKVFIQAADLIS